MPGLRLAAVQQTTEEGGNKAMTTTPTTIVGYTDEQAAKYRDLQAKAQAAEQALAKLSLAVDEARALSPIPYRFGRVTQTQKRLDASVEGLYHRLRGIQAAPEAYKQELRREAELAAKKAAQDAAAAAEAVKLQAKAGEAQRRNLRAKARDRQRSHGIHYGNWLGQADQYVCRVGDTWAWAQEAQHA